nr:MAG TPA: hypothetical protein [Caudoviricetes sp.]
MRGALFVDAPRETAHRRVGALRVVRGAGAPHAGTRCQ